MTDEFNLNLWLRRYHRYLSNWNWQAWHILAQLYFSPTCSALFDNTSHHPSTENLLSLHQHPASPYTNPFLELASYCWSMLSRISIMLSIASLAGLWCSSFAAADGTGNAWWYWTQISKTEPQWYRGIPQAFPFQRFGIVLKIFTMTHSWQWYLSFYYFTIIFNVFRDCVRKLWW